MLEFGAQGRVSLAGLLGQPGHLVPHDANIRFPRCQHRRARLAIALGGGAASVADAQARVNRLVTIEKVVGIVCADSAAMTSATSSRV